MWTEEEEEHIGDIRLLNNDGGNVSEGWSDIEIYVREVLEVYQHNSLMRHTRWLSLTLPLVAPAGNPQKRNCCEKAEIGEGSPFLKKCVGSIWALPK